MTEPSTPSPETARRNRRVLVGFFVFFAVAAVGTLIFGFQVVAGIKARAAESDAALRAVVWTLLDHADRHGGFPTSAADLGSEDSGTALEGVLMGGSAGEDAEWPVDRATAMGAFQPLPGEEAWAIVEISWPPDPTLPPVLSVGGRPCGLVEGEATLEVVNRWLRAASTTLSPAG